MRFQVKSETFVYNLYRNLYSCTVCTVASFALLTLSCLSLTKYRKCRKTAVRRAGCCLALCASRAETPRHSSTCPSLPKAGGQQPGWPWVPPSLYSRLQTPPCGMACRSARYPAYRMKAPDGPLGWPTAAGPLPSPEYVAASASLCYTPSLRHLPSFLTI